MIRIDRGDEPPALKKSRENRLKEAWKAWATTGVTPHVDAGYDQVSTRKQLFKAQHYKCAYCERLQGRSGQPIEHFRPKNGADRDNEPYDEQRYWWLAWSWDNLLLACATCNNPTHKGNKFPLEAGAAPLPLPPRTQATDLPDECTNTAGERRLLVDPGSDDPLDHLRWAPKNPQEARDNWVWKITPVDARGTRTAKVFGLDDPADGLEDQVSMILKNYVWPQVKSFLERVSAGADTAELAGLWAQLRLNFLDRSRMFVAAAWCALDTWVPEAMRQQHGLTLPRPLPPPRP